VERSYRNRMNRLLRVSIEACVLALMMAAATGTGAKTWIEDTFEDFADGTLDASGQNIYVSRDGAVRTIHRFDLNDDGFIDLLFNSTHDDYAFIPATFAICSKDRTITVKDLAVEGSLSAEIADLNRDGFPDVVFCPNPSGVQRSRRFVTVVWGGEDGYTPRRSNGLLPVHGARDLAVADLNADRWPDIVTLNQTAWLPGQPEGYIVRIYWGSKDGFLLKRYSDIGIQSALKLAAGDFDGDGASDIAVLAADGVVHILWAGKEGNADIRKTKVPVTGGGYTCISASDIDADGKLDLLVGTSANALLIIRGGQGKTWGDIVTVAGINASHIATGDIDGDGFVDLSLSNFVQVRAAGGEMTGGRSDAGQYVTILWGAGDGFSAERTTLLDAPYNIASAAVDLDFDGIMDVVCAVHQGEKVYATVSPVYFGRGNRRFERGGKGIPTEGAYHVAVVPSKGNRPDAVVISNSKGGSLREEVPLQLYWGGPNGFDPGRKLKIPFRSGYEATAADLDVDGYVDLIAIDEMHGGQGAAEDPYHGVNIFRGGAGGFDIEKRRTVLNEVNAGTSNVADLDRDGFLDIVVGFFDRGDRKPTELVIYYGSNEGFMWKNRAAVPCEGRSNSPMIADYDRDGWLDIAVNSFMEDKLHVFRGGPEGFSESRQTTVDIPGLIDIETADLNADGWLDIIACSYYDKVNNHNDTGVVLLWGGPHGFRQWDSQWLPGMTPLGPVVADFDADGFLDLFLPHYHSELTREFIPCYLYWGGPEGYFPRLRTALVNNSAADGLAADFDRDGLLDLAVVNHTVDGNHSGALSKVYYNGGKRFTDPKRIELLPSPGSHWMWNEDMGHIYTRRWEQTYESSVFSWENEARGGELRVTADISGGTSLRLEVRSAAAESGLSSAEWRETKAGAFSLRPGDRCLQYRATFISDNGDRYPVLDRVELHVQ